MTCPICRRPLSEAPAARAFRPFCSQRCRLVDLGGWLEGSYRIQGSAESDEDGDGIEAAARLGESDET